MWITSNEEYQDLLSYIDEIQANPIFKGRDSEGLKLFQIGDMLIHQPDKFGEQYEEKPKAATKTYDPLIFGKDSTECITNITVDNEQVFIYKSDGSCEIKEYYNWAIGANYDEDCTRLKGNQFYKYIKEISEDQYYSLKESWNPRIWTPRTASEGFMLRSGMTYYKGMRVSDVSLLSFDIEATSLNKDDPEAQVVLLSTTYRDKAGKIEKKLFDMFDFAHSSEFNVTINDYIKDKNPDVILGHNILSYDLPYLDKNMGLGLKWGKDGSGILFDEKASRIRKDGSQQYEFFNANIHGREIIDTFFLSIKYDISREFPSYGLKAIEKHLGYVKEDRTWDFNTWSVKKLIEAKKSGNDEIWQKFREYCQDDSDSPIKMFDLMIPSFFYLAQSIPKTLQQCINEGTGSCIDAFFIRAYLQDGFSLPRSSKPEEFQGAISFGIPGNYKNVFSVDFHALYPSIIKQYKLYDQKKDPNGYMLKATEYFTKVRVEYKQKFKETGDHMYEGMQMMAKIFANSIYGFCGANFLLFNSPDIAKRITEIGRELLDTICTVATGKSVYYWKDLNKEPEVIENED